MNTAREGFYCDTSQGAKVEKWPHLIGKLAERVAEASESHPTVRIWKDSELISMIAGEIKAQRGVLKTTFASAAEVIERLQLSRWLREIELEDNRSRRRFFLMDHEAPEVVEVLPEEVLLAALPSGVISYASAVQYYDLTSQTQMVAFVGRLARGHPPETVPRGPPPEHKNPLGTPLFCLEGVQCFETKRYCGLTPGICLRIESRRTWYRVTTLEQTLLDTLLQPERCGGEAAVFEAWERGVERVDWDRMADHMHAIQRQSLVRRVGAMASLLGFTPQGGKMQAALDSARKAVSRAKPAPVPMLAGMSYSAIDPAWAVEMP